MENGEWGLETGERGMENGTSLKNGLIFLSLNNKFLLGGGMLIQCIFILTITL
jgi:hypothetical protein